MPVKVLEHKVTGRVYPIEDVYEENGVAKVVIRGEHGSFTEDLDLDRFNEMGYKRATLADDDPRLKGKADA